LRRIFVSFILLFPHYTMQTTPLFTRADILEAISICSWVKIDELWDTLVAEESAVGNWDRLVKEQLALAKRAKAKMLVLDTSRLQPEDVARLGPWRHLTGLTERGSKALKSFVNRSHKKGYNNDAETKVARLLDVLRWE
jgi:hypothetical protein